MRGPPGPEVAADVPGSVVREFWPARSNAWGSVVMNVGVSAFSAFAAVTLLGRGELLGYAFGAVAAATAWGALRWIRRAARSRPSVTVMDDGLIDATSMGAPTSIRWSEVASVVPVRAGVELRFIEGHSVRLRLHQRLLRLLGGRPRGSCIVPTSLLDTPAGEVGEVVREAHERWLLESVRDAKAVPASSVDRDPGEAV